SRADYAGGPIHWQGRAMGYYRPRVHRRILGRGASAGSRATVTAEWVAAALVIALANFVLGLVGFGNGLVAMALLPFLMSPVTAIAVLTIYTIVFSTAIFVPVRRHLLARPVIELLAGTAIGAPAGVFLLSPVPLAALHPL